MERGAGSSQRVPACCLIRTREKGQRHHVVLPRSSRGFSKKFGTPQPRDPRKGLPGGRGRVDRAANAPLSPFARACRTSQSAAAAGGRAAWSTPLALHIRLALLDAPLLLCSRRTRVEAPVWIREPGDSSVDPNRSIEPKRAAGMKRPHGKRGETGSLSRLLVAALHLLESTPRLDWG